MFFFFCLCLSHYSLTNSKSHRTPMLLNSTPISSRTTHSLPTTIVESAPMQSLHGAHTRIGDKLWITRLISPSLGTGVHYPISCPSGLTFHCFLGTSRRSFLQAIAGYQIIMSMATRSSSLVREYGYRLGKVYSRARFPRVLPWGLSSRVSWDD